MTKNTNKQEIRINEKGQTLLFVVVAVTIALAVGVSVSTRTINSLRRVSRTDTSSRVIAAAEGGIENLLARPYSSLDLAINANDCEAIGAEKVFIVSDSSCVYEFSDSNTTKDQISSRAIVSVDKFNSNNKDGGYSFDLEPGSVKEIVLEDPDSTTYGSNTIKICWRMAQDPLNDAAIYYYSYDKDGKILKGGLYPPGFSYSGNLSYENDGRFKEADNGDTVDNYYCSDVTLVSNPSYGLRIKVLYNSSNVMVIPSDGVTLPNQGYVLTSIGEVFSSDGSEEKATVIVHKSYPYTPDIFDYGIYTPQTLN